MEYVRYVGTADVRMITKDEWRGAGVKDQDTVVWNRANRWTVPLEDISDNARPFIEDDPGLVVFDSDARKKEPERPTTVQVPIEGYPGGGDATGAGTTGVAAGPGGSTATTGAGGGTPGTVG